MVEISFLSIKHKNNQDGVKFYFILLWHGKREYRLKRGFVQRQIFFLLVETKQSLKFISMSMPKIV